MTRTVLMIVLVGAATPALRAQGTEATVEGRLLEILKSRGAISASEYDELRQLGEQMRAEGDLEKRLAMQVDEMVARISQDSPKTQYKVGRGFNWESADKRFSLTIGGRLQVRFTHEENDNDTAAGFFDEGEPEFDVPLARVFLNGHAFAPHWKYAFQLDIVGDTARGPLSVSNAMAGTSTGSFTSSNRLAEVKDAYLEFAKWKAFNVRAGQFKTPYSRQQLTSKGRQQFVDRAITDPVFASRRDFGLMLYGAAGGENDDFLEYSAGVFNGEGENQLNNDDGVLLVGRVAVNPFGEVKYAESAFGDPDDFRLAVGVNAWFHDNDNHNQAGARFDSWSVGGDLTVAWQRFFFTGELHYREDEQAGDERDIVGWFAQLGYFIVPDELEIAIRAANVDWDRSATNTAAREYLVVLGYFLEQHDLKIQADFGRIEIHTLSQAANDDEWRFRVQAQIVF